MSLLGCPGESWCRGLHAAVGRDIWAGMDSQKLLERDHCWAPHASPLEITSQEQREGPQRKAREQPLSLAGSPRTPLAELDVVPAAKEECWGVVL